MQFNILDNVLGMWLIVRGKHCQNLTSAKKSYVIKNIISNVCFIKKVVIEIELNQIFA